MIEISVDPANVVLPINEHNINKTFYIASKVCHDSVFGSTNIIAFVVERKTGWTWIYAYPNHVGQFHPTRVKSIHQLLSTEFRNYHSNGGQIIILESDYELKRYLQHYGIDMHFQQLLEVPWRYL